MLAHLALKKLHHHYYFSQFPNTSLSFKGGLIGFCEVFRVGPITQVSVYLVIDESSIVASRRVVIQISLSALHSEPRAQLPADKITNPSVSAPRVDTVAGPAIFSRYLAPLDRNVYEGMHILLKI